MVDPTSDRLLSSAAMIIDQYRSIGGDWLGQCHPAERFTGRLAYLARRDRISLGCKPLRRHRYFRGGPAAGGPAYSPIAIQFGEEPLFECLGRPVVFRIFEGDRAGLEDYRAQFSRAAAATIVEADEPDLPLGQCRFEEGHHRRTWKPMPCTEMEHRANKAVAAVGVVITPSCPVVVFSEKIQHKI